VIEVELFAEHWPTHLDWQGLAERATMAALRQSEHAELTSSPFATSISIKLADNDEVQTLNAQWRGKDKPTNVLSFPMLEAEELDALANSDDGEVLLGDMILAYGVCAAEAEEKDIPLSDHVTHLIVHGTLHLLGYDHVDDAEAEHMEALEVKALASLGLANPYIDD
jgi:probable rRNA maturation factor